MYARLLARIQENKALYTVLDQGSKACVVEVGAAVEAEVEVGVEAVVELPAVCASVCTANMEEG